MAFTISGRVRIYDQIKSGINLNNLRVTAYDSDDNADDYMGRATKIVNGGSFKIRVNKNKWDSAISKKKRRPDIFIIVEYWGVGKTKHGTGYWVKLYRSKTKFNHKGNLVINPIIKLGAKEAAATCFIPSEHGWKFSNSFDKKLFKVTVGMGFCGGMAFAALDRYNLKEAIDSRITIPKEGENLFKHLWNRQLTSFNSGDVIRKVTSWINKADESHKHRGHSVGFLTKKEMSEIKKQIRAGKPVPIVLVRHEGTFKTYKMAESHQVLIYKYLYERNLNRTRFWIYDPNEPKMDNIIITVYQGFPNNRIRVIHSDQYKARERGFFINKSYNKKMRICKKKFSI